MMLGLATMSGLDVMFGLDVTLVLSWRPP